MSNNSILLLDTSFDPKTAPACNLLVKVGLDSISYAIINKETRQVHAVFDEQECENGIKKLTHRLKADLYLSLAYHEVKIAIHSENIIDIPNNLYDENEVAAHTQFFMAPHSGNLYTRAQGHFELTTIFTLPKSIDELLNNNFATAKRFQETAGLLLLAAKINETALLLDFSVHSFHILYVNDQQLVFQQHYEIENVAEFNYYLLLIINQLGISKPSVHLSGIIHEGDEKYNCLLKYFDNIYFTAAGDDLNQEVIEDMPSHYYSTLLALDQCV